MNTTIASLRKTTLALAVLAGFCASNAMAATSTNPFVVAHTASLQSGDAVTGSVPALQPIHIEVVLKLRDRAGLDRFIDANAKSPVQHVMSQDQFIANHAPTQAQAQAVANYLGSMGYRNITIAPNRLLVSADGTAATANRAFMTSIEQVHTHDGRVAYMNTSDALVPAALQEQVLSVLGLQTVNQSHVFAAQGRQGVHTDVAPPPYNPLYFSPIYGGTGVATAIGVPVGLFVNGNVSGTLTDLATFATSNSLAHVNTSVVATNGGGGSDISGRLTWDTDSQAIVGMAGGHVGKLIFYTIPNLSNANVIANFNTIVSANAAKIIDVSFGGCERNAQQSGLAASGDEILAAGVAQGQTFAVATGDAGANECGDGSFTPSWPASSPYAVAVDGTLVDGSTTAWIGEGPWTDTGAASTFEPMPSWQVGKVVSRTFRGVPDVAFDGDPNTGAIIDFNGGTQTQGGTTLSASIFSGMWARVLAVKGSSIGFAGPLLYRLNPNDLHDLTSDIHSPSTATTNWDYVTGMGSLILNKLIVDVGNPDTGVTPPVPKLTVTKVGSKYSFNNTTTAGTYGSLGYFDFGDGSLVDLEVNGGYHAFPDVGTYNVTMTLYDVNNMNPVSTSVAFVSTQSGNQILNPGFEDGTAWSFSSPGLRSQIEPHGGQWVARLCGTGKAHTDVIKQTLAATGGTVTLTFWLRVESAEAFAPTGTDTLTVSVTKTNGAVLGTLQTFSDRDSDEDDYKYTKYTLDMTPYVTEPQVVLRFVGTENGSRQTTFFIDDVTVN